MSPCECGLTYPHRICISCGIHWPMGETVCRKCHTWRFATIDESRVDETNQPIAAIEPATKRHRGGRRPQP